jgi:hypothetical protein
MLVQFFKESVVDIYIGNEWGNGVSLSILDFNQVERVEIDRQPIAVRAIVKVLIPVVIFCFELNTNHISVGALNCYLTWWWGD